MYKVKKQHRGKIKKKHLLETALKLFSEKGYENVTVDEIVKKSNSSKGSFYLHFSAKNQLLLEKFKEIDSFYLDYVKTLPENLDACQKISLFIKSQMAFIEKELGKDLMRVIYSAALTPKENNYFLDNERALFKILRSFIEEGIMKKEIKSELSIDILCIMFNQSILGTIYYWCLGEDNNLEVSSVALVDTLIKGLKC